MAKCGFTSSSESFKSITLSIYRFLLMLIVDEKRSVRRCLLLHRVGQCTVPTPAGLNNHGAKVEVPNLQLSLWMFFWMLDVISI